jgi:hypothetical protein
VLDGLDADGVAIDVGTQAASQGAGQMRPVNSGKLLVLCSTLIAFFQSPRYTRSLKSGMMLLTGQPLLQNGVPQSMQRAPCILACSASGDDEFLVVLQTFRNRGVALFDALVFHEAGGLSHDVYSLKSVFAGSATAARPPRSAVFTWRLLLLWEWLALAACFSFCLRS